MLYFSLTKKIMITVFCSFLALLALPNFVELDKEISRNLGIGNSTGLGMAPFIVNHPTLLNNWILAREKALKKVREIKNVKKRKYHKYHAGFVL